MQLSTQPDLSQMLPVLGTWYLLPLAVDQLKICARKPSTIFLCICVDESLITVNKHVFSMLVILQRGCASAERLG